MCGPSAVLGVVSAGADGLEVNSGGTAKATGVVLENVHACQVDAACYLRLRVGDRDLRVTYAPAEGEKASHVRKATKEEWNAKKDDHVEAYGRYSKHLATQLRPIALIPSMFTF
jgi:hypothetical protein